MPDKPLLILARHSITRLNRQSAGESGERIRSTLDVPLTKEGIADAHKLADKIVKFPIEKIYASSLHRAMQTAEICSDKLGVPITATRDLWPWDLGWIAGQLVKDVLPTMKKYVKNEDQTVRGGESFATFRKRTLSFVRKVSEEAQRDGKVILCVTHTRDIQLVKAWLANGAPDDLTIDDATMDNYDDEVQPAGFLELEPGDVLGPEWKDGEDDEDRADK